MLWMDHKGKSIKKRHNKNRPEEKSSKIPPRQNVNKVHAPLDPRFDSSFGDYNEKAFNSSYGFINKIKKREKFHLKKQLKKEQDPEEIKKIRYLLTRSINQEREKKKRDMKQKKLDLDKQKFAEAVFAGEAPSFPNKKEQLAEELLQNFESLSSRGKLNKYIMKKHKKMSQKNKKSMVELS